MRACGKTSCSRQCRDIWAWKHWLCLQRSFETLPPTHHVVLHPIKSQAADTFAKDIGKGMTRLGTALDSQVEYARVFEWKKGRIHAHLLLRVTGPIPRGRVKQVMDKVRPGGFRVSCMPVESVPAMARYFVKHLTDRDRRAELTPDGFRGRVFQASRAFLVRPLAKLRQELLTEWRDKQLRDSARLGA